MRQVILWVGVATLLVSGTGPALACNGTPCLDAGNVVPLAVRTPHAGYNRMVVSVTVCVPDTGRCATIDDVMIDTGSTGLRLEASALPPGLTLPPFLGPDRKPLAECLAFVHDNAWGPLYRTDLRLGGLVARNLPIQIIADQPGPQPDACPRSDAEPTSNGTLGIGPQRFDCAGPCEQRSSHPGVFVQEAGAWMPVQGSVAEAYRLPNPVSRFPQDNDGIVLDLPAPLDGGAKEAGGVLTLGVGTALNNQLGPAEILRLDETGRFTTLYDRKVYPDSVIDSGTETYILSDGRLPRCDGMPWAFCARPDRPLMAVLVGHDGTQQPVSFTVGDFQAMRDRRFGASDRVAIAADSSSSAFVWGAPFFFGKRVSIVIDGRHVPGREGLQGPFYAIEAEAPVRR